MYICLQMTKMLVLPVLQWAQATRTGIPELSQAGS